MFSSALRKHQKSFDFVTELAPTGASAEVPVNNDGTTSEGAETESSEYPPWSSEVGMIHWMYARCERRMNRAVLSHKSEKTNRYVATQQILSDMLAWKQLMMSSATTCSRCSMTSLTCQLMRSSTMNTGGRRHALLSEGTRGATAAFLHGVAATQLMGCSGDGTEGDPSQGFPSSC